MSRFFLHIYDRLSGHRTLTWIILLVTVGVLVLLASRMHYGEDISEFLPVDPGTERYAGVYSRMSDQGRITVVFRSEDSLAVDGLYDAVDVFGQILADKDTSGLLAGVQLRQNEDNMAGMLDFAASHFPYFLQPEDISRMDSLLAVGGYIGSRMDNAGIMMLLPGTGMAGAVLRYDPLGLFTPVLQRLAALAPDGEFQAVDGYVTDRSGTVALAFVTSPFGGSETMGNKAVAGLLEEAMDSTMELCPGVRVSAAGAPLIAVANADRIRRDTVLSASLAAALILLVLALAFRRPSSIVWTFVSVLFGLCAALGLMALIKGSVSLIVIGIGTVLVGIAVNYPLHYFDYLKYASGPREVLRDIVSPMLTGNITTVSAFLCLLFLKAEAMRDLGLFGALMLLGTILFVLIFLPVLAPGQARGRGEAGPLFLRRSITFPAPVRKAVFAAVVLVTLGLLVFGRGASFDSNLMNINYMTEAQKRDMALLTSSVASSGDSAVTVYAVAEGKDMEQALRSNELMLEAVGKTEPRASVRGINGFLPSVERQEEILGMWRGFLERHPGLSEQVAEAASEKGLPEKMFAPFEALLAADPGPLEADEFGPLSLNLQGTYVLPSDGGVQIVNLLSCPDGGRVEALRATGTGLFFTSEDVSSRLVEILSESFDFVGAVCSAVVFLFLCFSFGRVETAVMAFLPLAVGWVWILGIMDVFGITFNIVNIILAAFIFGQGDDYTIFVTEGLMHEYAYGRKVLSSYKDSVLLSAVIMFIAIGMLVLARHPAMKSLAEVTVVGMTVVVLMAFYLPPLVFRFLTRRRGEVRELPLTIRRLAYSLWALVFYLVAAFLVLLPWTWFYFHTRRRTDEVDLRYHRLISRVSGFIIRHVPGVRFSMSNPGGETFERPSVIIADHQSHLDLMCIMMLTPRMVILTNRWASRNPLYSRIIRRLDFYSVSDGVEELMPRLRAMVGRGYSVMVFPEGTRSLDLSVGRFHKGAFYIARELGLDVLPVYIHGAGHVLPKRDFMLRRGSIYVEVGERIPYRDLSLYPTLAKLTSAVRKQFAARYGEICSRRENTLYYSDYIRHKYLYKGRDVETASRMALRLAARHCREIDCIPGDVRSIEVRGCGQGEVAWALALVHPQVQVYGCEADEESFLVAANTSAQPANLHFVHGTHAGTAVDMVLELREWRKEI